MAGEVGKEKEMSMREVPPRFSLLLQEEEKVGAVESQGAEEALRVARFRRRAEKTAGASWILLLLLQEQEKAGEGEESVKRRKMPNV